jgi:hypothetical protein
MSDQAATEKKFNEGLEILKSSILPKVVANWGNMSKEAQDASQKMFHFFCGLHLLVNLADQCNSVISKFEMEERKNDSLLDEAGPIRMVRTTCKAFARGGDAKCGQYLPFKMFCQGRGKVSHLATFRGNRFNILFFDSEQVFYLQDEVIEFIENVFGASNKLLAAVLHDCKDSFNLAVCKALGILCKSVTSPLWRIIEKKGSVLDMNPVFHVLLGFLKRNAVDASGLLSGDDVPFAAEEGIVKDEVHKRLFTSDSYDDTTTTALQLICSAWASYLSKAVRGHLEGGEHYGLDTDEEVREKLSSVQKHNKFCERIFGITDYLMRYRPNATTMANEAFIMFSQNKTAEWLENKTSDERECLIKKARKGGSELRAMYQERKKEIETTIQSNLKTKQKQLQNKRLTLLKRKEKLTIDIQIHGLWQSKESVLNHLHTYSTESKKIEALKIQLNFRKKVLIQESVCKDSYKFSSKQSGKFSSEKLAHHLLELIENVISVPDKEGSLAGKRIRHRFNVENGKQELWEGLVCGIVTGFPDWCNIKYDGENTIYTYYKIEEDMVGDDPDLVVVEWLLSIYTFIFLKFVYTVACSLVFPFSDIRS